MMERNNKGVLVLGYRPMSSLEIKMDKIIKENKLSYKFVGNGKFSIERKVPDFINTNGEKIALEVFYRKHKNVFSGRLDNWMNKRKELFMKYGWKIEFFNECQVNNEEVIRRLN